MLSYAIWNDFEIRMPTYIDQHPEYDEFDIVKWVHCDPYEAVDLFTGKKKTCTEYCFSIGKLKWNDDTGMRFESCGTRYLRHRADGLEEFLLEFIEAEENKRRKE